MPKHCTCSLTSSGRIMDPKTGACIRCKGEFPVLDTYTSQEVEALKRIFAPEKWKMDHNRCITPEEAQAALDNWDK